MKAVKPAVNGYKPGKLNAETWVVISAYNEKEALPQVLNELSQFPYHVLVVDDGSIDGTMELARKYPAVWLRHICNLGQGAALETGFEFIRQKTRADFIVTFDADGQHSAGDISRLIAALIDRNVDAVLGSRFLEGGKVKNLTKEKECMLKLAIFFTRLTTGLALTDTHNGLRAFTRAALMKIHLTQNGMAHASEILAQIKKQKLTYCEVPVTITYTPYSMKKGQRLSNSINILWDFFFGGN